MEILVMLIETLIFGMIKFVHEMAAFYNGYVTPNVFLIIVGGMIIFLLYMVATGIMIDIYEEDYKKHQSKVNTVHFLSFVGGIAMGVALTLAFVESSRFVAERNQK